MIHKFRFCEKFFDDSAEIGQNRFKIFFNVYLNLLSVYLHSNHICTVFLFRFCIIVTQF